MGVPKSTLSGWCRDIALTEEQALELFKNKLKGESAKIEDESELDTIIEKVIKNNEKAVSDYKAGNENSLQFLLGMVMRETGGKASAGVVLKLLKEKLGR